MNFLREDRQLLNVTANPLKRYQNNISGCYPDTRSNRFVPPLIQTRPVIKMTNSKQFSAQQYSETKFANFATNGSMTETSVCQPLVSQAFNRTRVSTSRVGTYFDGKNSDISTNVSETKTQKHQIPTTKSTVSSRGSSFVEINGNSNTIQNQSSENAISSSFYFKIFGSTENEKMFIFTGTAERVIKWNKIFRNHFCYYEVIASVVSIQEGSVNTQKIMLLRDKKGPILQVVYYNTVHIDIEDFYVEQVLRCVGSMSAPNILNAVSIRSATQEEIETLQRLCLVCDHAVSHFLSF